ncbi:hypothetical protein CAMRE0001_1983 [Campylobacter rectus RM3267]|uniref:Uncharacterized protein n=1 Tax=Campylobacter rectus RM3267 TaxID=553218 RepID=B9D3A8_CAMRE|nr:hypothetical protein CAMRE0001_1983 [Campylobacter rectus RM3267]
MNPKFAFAYVLGTIIKQLISAQISLFSASQNFIFAKIGLINLKKKCKL